MSKFPRTETYSRKINGLLINMETDRDNKIHFCSNDNFQKFKIQ